MGLLAARIVIFVLCFQADIVFEYIASSVQQKLWSKVTSLKMYSSIYGAPSSQNTNLCVMFSGRYSVWVYSQLSTTETLVQGYYTEDVL